MAKLTVDLLVQPQMLGSRGWAELLRQLSQTYPNRSLTLHLQRFNGRLNASLAEALRESARASARLTPAPHKKLPEDDYAVRLTWRKGKDDGG